MAQQAHTYKAILSPCIAPSPPLSRASTHTHTYLDEEHPGLILVEKSGRAEGGAVCQDNRLDEGAETVSHLLSRKCRCVCMRG